MDAPLHVFSRDGYLLKIIYFGCYEKCAIEVEFDEKHLHVSFSSIGNDYRGLIYSCVMYYFLFILHSILLYSFILSKG